MSRVLDEIQKENDIKKIQPEQYKVLASEIRHFLVEKVSKTGGHLSSNLGVVELTMALHLFLDFPNDKLIWDVGHQSYTHKILTGRKNDFDTLRQFNGLSGFPKRSESDCDVCDTGHSSTSISIALGMAAARDINQRKDKIIAVIGDGALSGGMAYEALNNAARLKSNLMIVLNDNNMSISENVGGMAVYLGKIRTNKKYQGLKSNVETMLNKVPNVGNAIADRLKKSKDSIKRLVIPGMLFEDMGLTYIGPVDGHNIEQILTALSLAEKLNRAVMIHVVTKKGKGYPKAEKNPSWFHSVDPFLIKTGEPKHPNNDLTYTKIYGKKLSEMAERENNIVAITAAMPSGTGISKFQESFPERYFDVGIAEEYAVSFAAGLALSGCHPFVSIYSTFLQRAYDQILHDVCINHVSVVFAIDRAGITGRDGETHQGIFDLSYLSSIPGLAILAPKNKWEFEEMLEFLSSYESPAAIRYPKGKAYDGLEDWKEPIVYGKSEWIYRESGIALFAVGSMVEIAEQVRSRLKEAGYSVSLVNARFVQPLDQESIEEMLHSHTLIVTLEENVKSGGFGEHVFQYISEQDEKEHQFLNISIPDEFVQHGNKEKLMELLGLDVTSIVERILEKV